MPARLNPFAHNAAAYKGMMAVETAVAESGLEEALILLVKTRASQINGCAYCIAMHTRDAIKHGETAQRLFLLDAWDETELFTDRERAALEWTEALTRVSETHAPDAAYERVRGQFSEKETADLIFLIAAINAWNRIAISSRLQPEAG